MKQHLLALSVITATALTALGQIPEAGFENWSSGNCGEPTGWSTVNGSTSILGLCTAQRETANPYSGSSALKIQTGQLGFPVFQTVPGLVSNGTINIQSQSVSGGVPFTDRPTAFTGWYRAEPVNGDTYSMIAVLINEVTGDSVGVAIFEGTSTVTDWTFFSQPVQYLNQQTPTLLQITMFASDPNNPQIGSTVYFDELDYESITVGISETERERIMVYPNPVINEVYFELGEIEQAVVSIYNMIGVRIMESNLSGMNNRLDMTSLPSGTYIWQLASLEGEPIKTGKFLVVE